MYPKFEKKDFKENPVRRVYKNSKCASKRKEKKRNRTAEKAALSWLTRSNGSRKRSFAVNDKRK